MRARLFAQVLSLEARKSMSYRIDFWINSLVGILAHFVLVYSLWASIMATGGAQDSGYSFEAIVLYYVLVILLGKLVGSGFHQGEISSDIYDGTLSRYLLFPSSVFAFKYAQRLGALAPLLAQVLVLGLAYFLFLPLPEDVALSATTVAMGCASLVVASLLFHSLSWLVQLVAFWGDNVWSLVVMMLFVARLLGGSMIPLSMFPDWSQGWLVALPFRYLYGFPADTIMGRVPTEEWLQGLAISLGWVAAVGLASTAVWRRGMLSYSGVGI